MPSPLREPISDWLDLDSTERPRPLRRLRRWLSWAAFFASALAVAAFTGTSGKSIYQARPLSSAHSMFNHDCGVCHTQSFQPLARLLKGDDSIRSVTDEACTKCHPGSIHQVTQKSTPSCASCHREHQGKPHLSRVSDGHCLACHGDLGVAHMKGETRIESFADFAHHPEFRVWNTGGTDPGTIRFNHQKHLVADGVLTIPSFEPWRQERTRRKLECADCHRLDDAGRYMQPVKYDKHCQGCHPLNVQVFGEWKGETVQKAMDDFRHHPAPHRAPQVVHAEMRERYTRFSRLVHRTAAPALEPPIPGSPRRPAITSKEQWEWVEQQLGQLEQLLFRQTSVGCQYCHAKPFSTTPDGLPHFLAASINERLWTSDGAWVNPAMAPPDGIDGSRYWLPHARFHHESHRMLACTACHKNAKTSAETSDLLLPKISDCKQCHNAQTGVRFDCATCHTYHSVPNNRTFRGTRTLEECLGSLSPLTHLRRGTAAEGLRFAKAGEDPWPSK
jgi:hypothetical protein